MKCYDSPMVLIGESEGYDSRTLNSEFKFRKTLWLTLWSVTLFWHCFMSFLYNIRVRRMWLRSSTTFWDVRSGRGRPQWSTSALSRTSSSCCSKGEVCGALTYTTTCYLQCWGVVLLCLVKSGYLLSQSSFIWRELPHCLNIRYRRIKSMEMER